MSDDPVTPDEERQAEAEDRSVMRFWICVALVLLMFLAWGFAQAKAAGFSGRASYYGNESGRRTASGARFNQSALTAAHRSLPFGTRLRVTKGSRSVVVVINDRGPFIRGRVLDLSRGAARTIGLTGAGVGRITAEVLP